MAISPSRWQKRLQMKREGKDRFFRGHRQSPPGARERERFKGLEYFPVDPSYRFELELHEHDEKETVRVEATHGGVRELLRRGEFRFKLGGEECALQVYQSHPAEETLFCSFQGCDVRYRNLQRGTLSRPQAGDTSYR